MQALYGADTGATTCGTDWIVLAKPYEIARVNIIALSNPTWSLTSAQPWSSGCLTDFSQFVAAPRTCSPRLGGHAFPVAIGNQAELEATLVAVAGRDDAGGFITPVEELLDRPHRVAARIEIDGENGTPAESLRSACKKSLILCELLTSNPNLSLDHERHPFDPFWAFASGNRSLHLLARSASAPAAGMAEGMRAWCHRVNAIAASQFGIARLVDPFPHTNVRAPWRAMYTPHEVTGLWANPIPWDVIWRCDGEAIVDLCRRPVTEHWLTAAIGALGFNRPADPSLTPFYDRLRWFGELDENAERYRSAVQLPVVRQRRGELDYLAALQEGGFLGDDARAKHGKGHVLRRCPGCRESKKAYVTFSGFIRCFRGTCDFADGVPPLGERGWFERLGLDPCAYGWTDEDEGERG